MTRPRVLIVEDDPAISRIVEQTLENAGYETALAETKKEALESVGAQLPDLILLDISLPDSSDLKLCRELTHTNKASPPVIIMTSKQDTITQLRGFEAGAEAFLIKPFSREELLNCVGVQFMKA